MPPRKVLMTGATGYIASQLLPVFRERYELTLLDVTATRQGQAVPGVIIANLAAADYEQYQAHFQGIDTVVHLGYHRSPAGEWGTRN